MYETIILPKGTVLFRSTHSTLDFVRDFAGIPKKDDEFCLYPNFNVFFYPFPFVSESVSKYSYTSVFILLNDVKLINLISPSKFTRKDRLDKKGGIVSCDKVDSKGCTEHGYDYDPCIDFDIVKDKEVVGMIAIAHEDAKQLRNLLLVLKDENINNDNKKTHRDVYYNKYYKLYKDARDVIGVPEIILYPRKYILQRKHTETIRDFTDWMFDNQDSFNYTIFRTVKEFNELEELMEQLMSDEGYNIYGSIYKISINKETGFFQMSGFTEPYIHVDTDNILSRIHDEFKFVSANLEELETMINIEISAKIDEWIENKDTDAYLVIAGYNLKTVPLNLPKNLKRVILNTNKIETLENIPDSVIELVIANNNISHIKELPKKLEQLHVSHNKLKSIEKMPNTITRLDIGHNIDIERIVNLPESLERFIANDCSIEYIKSFPKNLIEIVLDNNRLESLPNLPNKLRTLNIKNNPIYTLPTMPATIEYIAYDEPDVPGINDI